MIRKVISRTIKALEVLAGKEKGAVLSSDAILKAMKSGKIIIEPFSKENLETVSYDIILGKNIFKLKKIPSDELVLLINSRHIWEGPVELRTAQEWGKILRLKIICRPEDIADGSKGVVLMPGERILAHSEEFIGSNSGEYTTKIFDRSTAARWGISIVLGAGCGDPGYFNRWALEIKNENPFSVFLAVGKRIAQIQFWVVDTPSPIKSTSYQQPNVVLRELKEKWKPEDILQKAL